MPLTLRPTALSSPAYRDWADYIVLEDGYTFQTAEGRAEMIAELSRDTDNFEKLASDIMDATQAVRKRLGISEEKLNTGVEKQLAELQGGMVLD
jgi:predicted secreted protein